MYGITMLLFLVEVKLWKFPRKGSLDLKNVNNQEILTKSGIAALCPLSCLAAALSHLANQAAVLAP